MYVGNVELGKLTAFEPADDKVVGERQDPGRSDSIVSSNISDDVDLRSEGHVRPEECFEQGSERTEDDPESDGVENYALLLADVRDGRGFLVRHSPSSLQPYAYFCHLASSS
jgi:hypothetical protein